MLAAACIAPAGARDDDRWQRLDGFLQDSTGSGRFPGAVALVEHRGRIVFHGHWGHADSAGTRPLREDAIFRIYSMTKPVTSVAVLMLMEEGRLALDDPLSRYLPAFADRQVVVGGDARHPQLAPSPRAITLRHLLTHTSGLAADSAAHPVATGLLDAAGIDAATSLEDVAARLATLPLAVECMLRFRMARPCRRGRERGVRWRRVRFAGTSLDAGRAGAKGTPLASGHTDPGVMAAAPGPANESGAPENRDAAGGETIRT